MDPEKDREGEMRNKGVYKTALCSECGQVIVVGVLQDGKRILLDPLPEVYAVDGVPHLEGGYKCERVEGVLVSHVMLCRGDMYAKSRT